MIKKVFRTNRFRDLLKRIFYSFGIMLVLLTFVGLIVPENSSGGWLVLVIFIFLCYWISVLCFYIASIRKKVSAPIDSDTSVIDKGKSNSVTQEIKTLDGKFSNKEKIHLILNLLKKDNLEPNNILLPDDLFYYEWNGSADDLRLMASKIFAWLKIRPKNLCVDFYSEMEPPGIYISDKENEAIFINSKHRESAFECGAILAHEIMHYYLMGNHGIALADTKENELMTDLATIYSGLGVLVINSFYHYSAWHETLIGLFFGVIRTRSEKRSFGYFDPSKYGRHFEHYLSGYKINKKLVFSRILPTAKAYLSLDFFNNTPAESLPEYMKTAKKLAKQDTLKRVALMVVLIPIGILFLAWRSGAFNSTKSIDEMTTQEQTQATNLKTSIEQLETQYNTCNTELTKDKSALDDTEAQMNLYNNSWSTDKYNELVPLQNQQVATYNAKIAECQNLASQHDSKVDQYNSIIKK